MTQSQTPLSEDDFATLLHQYLIHKGLTTFSHDTFLSSPEIRNIANRVLLDQYEATELTEKRVIFLINRALAKLWKSGKIITKEDGWYEVVNHTANLGMVLGHLVGEETGGLDDSAVGVPLNYILVRLRDWQGGCYKYVKREAVVQSLALLVDSSEIYEVGRAEYRSF
ncbi:hypothetical protein HK097_008506 [Rhizophlyctis rosea]|uniref:Uncharacterized protein n=1 Tax=Rhizophlyctis rosea TaxID=64517 RepID=A0AAD5X599_9FUNG|nr:hypothetical protein HK097_008506 [Rhizophlyctis rosea]